MNELKFTPTEVHLGVDIFGFIESKKELGATTAALKEKYEDKELLGRVVQILSELGMIMKTGICVLTYVHRTYVKPWIVNTYNLKRLNRVSSPISSIVGG